MRLALALSLLLAIPLAACSSSSRGTYVPDGGGAGGSGAGGGSGGTPSAAGAVALSVTSASAPLLIDYTSPSSGNAFEELDTTLENKSSATPVSLDFALFTLGTAQSLVVKASGLSGTLTPECSPTNSVASGGSFSCKLAFEIPTGQKATTLHYDDQQGHQASAAVPATTSPPPPPPTTCQQSANVWMSAYSSPSTPCGNCSNQVQTFGQCLSQATAEQNVCGNSCYYNCVGSNVTPSSFCSCYKACATPSCWTATQKLLACLAQACASSC